MCSQYDDRWNDIKFFYELVFHYFLQGQSEFITNLSSIGFSQKTTLQNFDKIIMKGFP
jgi:hypothetical protein